MAPGGLGGAGGRRRPAAGRRRGRGPGARACRPRARLRQCGDRRPTRAPARLLTHGPGVAAAEELGLVLDDDAEDDDERLVDEVADSDALLTDDGAAGEFAAVEVAGAVVVGEDGVGVVVPVVDLELLASSP